MNYYRLIYLFIIVLLFFSCSNNNSNVKFETDNNDTLLGRTKIKYAKGFEIENYKNYKILIVKNPWQGAEDIEYKYVLRDKTSKIPNSLKKLPVIDVPVKRIICLSTTHIALIDFVDKTNTIVGVSGTNYVINSNVRARIDSSIVKDIGNEQSLNFELIVSLKPDLLMLYGIGSELVNTINKLKELNIQTIINGDYLESSPLGKAEWSKFVAELFNEQELASSKFETIEREYLQLKKMLDTVKNKPTVFLNMPWKGSWYMVGGESYIASLLKDAGAVYLWNNAKTNKSLAIDIEVVFEKAQSADFWLNIGSANTKKDIIDNDIRLKKFKAFSNNRLYNNNLIQNKYGGNDYWESGIVNPHLLLRDLISIFHPQLLDKHKLIYYKNIK